MHRPMPAWRRPAPCLLSCAWRPCAPSASAGVYDLVPSCPGASRIGTRTRTPPLAGRVHPAGPCAVRSSLVRPGPWCVCAPGRLAPVEPELSPQRRGRRPCGNLRKPYRWTTIHDALSRGRSCHTTGGYSPISTTVSCSSYTKTPRHFARASWRATTTCYMGAPGPTRATCPPCWTSTGSGPSADGLHAVHWLTIGNAADLGVFTEFVRHGDPGPGAPSSGPGLRPLARP